MHNRPNPFHVETLETPKLNEARVRKLFPRLRKRFFSHLIRTVELKGITEERHLLMYAFQDNKDLRKTLKTKGVDLLGDYTKAQQAGWRSGESLEHTSAMLEYLQTRFPTLGAA